MTMFRGVRFFLVFALCFVLASCGRKTPTRSVAHGNAGDIIVVMNDENWNSEAGDTLRAVFSQFCRGLAYEQYIMDLHQIPYSKFVDINQLHRNIIFFERIASLEKGELAVENNKYAENQVFVRVSAPNQTEFVKVVSDKRDYLLNLFLDADRSRWIASYELARNSRAEEQIAKKFNIDIKLPSSYSIDEILEDFAWISSDTRKSQSGIFVYEYPLTDSVDLSLEQIISSRNAVLQRCVPGGPEGSYMTTETEFDYPVIETITHNGQKTAVVHGLWKMHGDFMGGPFVSYTKIDEARSRVVCVEGFIYEPNVPLRDKIRKTEGVIYTYSIK
ncbi:MAG: DUF4837 family protein [Bacteroidales bacterium]|nr:DUF4837 family protein [Bacteroidales bacterium]